MSVSHAGSRLRRLHSKTKASKHGLSQYISGRSASFQSLQLVLEGELGDCTSVLSKEWQALTPRSGSCTSAGSSATLPHACLDGLLDGIAELSTSAADRSVRSGASYGGSDGGSGMLGLSGGRSACSRGGSPFGACPEPYDSPTRGPSQHTSSPQVVPLACGSEGSPRSQWTACTFDDGSDSGTNSRRVPAMRSNSLDSSCSGGVASKLSPLH